MRGGAARERERRAVPERRQEWPGKARCPPSRTWKLCLELCDSGLTADPLSAVSSLGVRIPSPRRATAHLTPPTVLPSPRAAPPHLGASIAGATANNAY